MFKRNIFILLGSISTILPPIIFTMTGHRFESILMSILIYLMYVIVSMLWLLTFSFLSDETPDIDVYIPFFFMPLTLNRKRIYYSDLGYFYMSIKNSRVIIYRQSYLYSKKIFSLCYNGDVDVLRKDVKEELDIIYREELSKKRSKSNLKEWDGYIDTVSKRDDKINQILK